MPALTPPRFVNLPSDAVYGDLPASLFLSLARLRGLAWNQPDKTTLPPLTLGELSIVLGCRERQTWEHLHALRRAGWLAWLQNDGLLYIRLTQPTLQSFASSGDQGDDDEEKQDSTHSVSFSSSSPIAALQNFATNLAVLAEFGVESTDAEARAVAQLPHVTPDLIRAWGMELQNTPKVKQLPRLLLHKLRYTKQFPKPEEHRGGARTRATENAKVRAKDFSPLPTVMAKDFSPLPTEPQTSNFEPPALPDDVREALEALGWTDDLAEVQAHFAREPQRVRAWLEHARTSKTARDRAALFRWGLRQEGRYPPTNDTPPPSPSPTSTRKYVCDNELFGRTKDE